VSEETAKLRELAEKLNNWRTDPGIEWPQGVSNLLEQAVSALRSSAVRVEKLQSQLSEATKPVTDEEVAKELALLRRYRCDNTAFLLERLAREKEEALRKLADAARAIPEVSGTVEHRIHMLRDNLSADIRLLTERAEAAERRANLLEVNLSKQEDAERRCQAWQDFAEHQMHCAACGEAVQDCEQGTRLWHAALGKPK
jgi:uncharacterized SAM-binding protein YcdF (DUF218 family)